MTLAWVAYRALAPVLGTMAPSVRWLTSPHERAYWRERLGNVVLPGGCHAWVHAASLGEARAVGPLVEQLERHQPGLRLCLTATTRTGRARLAELDYTVSLAPIDAPQVVRRFVRGIQPERLLLVETELWPHWLMRARAEGIPVSVLSARLSERSVRRYLRLGRGMRDLVWGLAAVLCQSEADAGRWLRLGARPARVRVVGNLKSDGLPGPAPDRAAARARVGLDPVRPLLVLGSLRPGEVRHLARALGRLPAEIRAHWQVVAVPRHERATAELREEARAAGISEDGAAPASADNWHWDDRPGVLVSFYLGAEVAFVGGSLAQYGGHNPLEPAACGAAVIMGPHTASQRESVRLLRDAGALLEAAPGAPLEQALATLLGDAATRTRAARASLEVASRERGSAERAVAALVEWGLWPVA